MHTHTHTHTHTPHAHAHKHTRTTRTQTHTPHAHAHKHTRTTRTQTYTRTQTHTSITRFHMVADKQARCYPPFTYLFLDRGQGLTVPRKSQRRSMAPHTGSKSYIQDEWMDEAWHVSVQAWLTVGLPSHKFKVLHAVQCWAYMMTKRSCIHPPAVREEWSHVWHVCTLCWFLTYIQSCLALGPVDPPARQPTPLPQTPSPCSSSSSNCEQDLSDEEDHDLMTLLQVSTLSACLYAGLGVGMCVGMFVMFVCACQCTIRDLSSVTLQRDTIVIAGLNCCIACQRKHVADS